MEMWEGRGSFEENPSTVFKRELRVLLVDHDKQYLYSLATLFGSNSYNVTAVERAGIALQILTERPGEFDLMIADIYLNDVDTLTLMRVAVNMGLLVMLMTTNSDHSFMERALSSGALLLVDKPMTEETLKYIWQVVRREKMRKGITAGERGNLDGEMRGEIKRCQVENSNGERHMEDNDSNGTNYVRKKRGRKSKKQRDEGYESAGFTNGTKLKRKACTEWTEELHAKFMDAVQQLGEGRCYPTEILEIMNVPGLTRMQVASHLQKCRNDNWRTTERKPKRSSNRHSTVPHQVNDNGVIPKSNNRKFGSMPFINPNNPYPYPVHPSNNNPQNPPQNSAAPELSSSFANSLDNTNNTAEDMDPISPPQPQNPPQHLTQNQPQLFDTHPLFPNNTQIHNLGPLGSLSMSDSASENVTGPLCSLLMSDNDNAPKDVTGPLGSLSISDNALKNVIGPLDSLLESDNTSKNVNMTMGMVNFDNPFETPSSNPVHGKVVFVGMTSHETCYKPNLSDLNMATPGTDPRDSSSLYQKTVQSSGDFLDFNREMDEYIQNFDRASDESMIYEQSFRTKQVYFDFDPGFPDQFSMEPNGHGPGKWSSSGAGTMNFLGE